MAANYRRQTADFVLPVFGPIPPLAVPLFLEGRVPPGKIAHFAGEARVTDVADLRKIQDEGKRLVLVASLVHVVRARVRDDVVTMFCKRMSAIHKKGRDHLEALREAHRAESERLLGVLGDVLSAVREAAAGGGDGQGPAAGEDAEQAAGRLVLKTLERAGGVEALSAAHEAVSAHHGGNCLPLLDRHYRSHRSALFTLVDAIELESTSAERSVVDAVMYLRELRNAKASHVPERVEAGRLNADGEAETVTVAIDVGAFASAAWRKILQCAHQGTGCTATRLSARWPDGQPSMIIPSPVLPVPWLAPL
ncbi:MAG: hypothetical protein ACRDRJ_34030 [Streptosporangiaceae bacterium]